MGSLVNFGVQVALVICLSWRLSMGLPRIGVFVDLAPRKWGENQKYDVFSVSIAPPPSCRLFGEHYFLALETHLKMLAPRATNGPNGVALRRTHYVRLI